MITKTEKAVAAVFVMLVALAAIAFFTVEPAYGGQDKVTICHATSSETNPFVTLTLAAPAVYGPAGHFNENGTTQAGHEQDYLGACEEEEPPVDPEDPPVDPDPPTVPEDPKPVLCPDGLPPTPGEGAFDPNDDCARPPVVPEEEEEECPIDTTSIVPGATAPDFFAPLGCAEELPTTPEPGVEPPVEEEQPVIEEEPTFKEQLEQQAKKQAKSNGAPLPTTVPANESSATESQAAAELPRTGLPLGLVALLGAALSGTGLWLRRRP